MGHDSTIPEGSSKLPQPQRRRQLTDVLILTVVAPTIRYTGSRAEVQFHETEPQNRPRSLSELSGLGPDTFSPSSQLRDNYTTFP